MGNQTSKTSTGSPSSASASPTTSHHESPQPPSRRAPRRKESLQAFSAKPTVAQSTATPEFATGTHSSQTQERAQHSRSRSQTSATSSLKEYQGSKTSTDIPSRQRSTRSTGSADKHDLSRSRSPLPHPISVPEDAAQHGSAADHATLENPAAVEDAQVGSPPDQSSEDSPAGYYMARDAMFGRPPRLPLPIEEEQREPGSPIISSADVQQPIGEDGVVTLQQQTSMLSTTTADDDTLGDDLPVDVERQGPKYPTLIEWTQPGEKVFVTGTFADWGSKHKLHKNGPSSNPDALSRLLSLPIGTHYIMFLVDGQMVTSQNLPTTVDYTNSLVNYIEVSMPAEKPPKPEPGQETGADTKERTNEPSQPIVIPAGPHPGPQVQAKRKPPSRQGSASEKHANKEKPEQKPRRVLPPREYTSDIPRFLLDLDEPEESTRFYRTQNCMMTLPQPPSLPSWLNKSILNGTMPMKDDSSVLNTPNHTVLNHLATSSIKQEVLATSATTRYKNKMVTTIMYNPTKDVS